jgi:hypothetical protein
MEKLLRHLKPQNKLQIIEHFIVCILILFGLNKFLRNYLNNSCSGGECQNINNDKKEKREKNFSFSSLIKNNQKNIYCCFSNINVQSFGMIFSSLILNISCSYSKYYLNIKQYLQSHTHNH